MVEIYSCSIRRRITLIKRQRLIIMNLGEMTDRFMNKSFLHSFPLHYVTFKNRHKSLRAQQHK